MLPDVDEEAGRATKRSRWQALTLPLAVGLCYANSLGVPFLMDDPLPTAELPFDHRALTHATIALNRLVSGGATWSYHVFNALVHLACGACLLALLRRLLPLAARGLAPGAREGLALVTTLIWLVHPLQTESVTYISQRAETLAALGYLGFLLAFLRAATEPRALGWLALALVSLALGFATKEIVATAPLLAWLIDGLWLSPGFAAAPRARWRLYLALGLAWCACIGLFILPTLITPSTSVGFGLQIGSLEYARSQPGVILHYLRLAFWPHPLCLDYRWPVAANVGQILPQSLAVLALIAATLWGLVRRSWLGLAGAWFFVILAPTSSLVPILDLAFEHRMYLPLAAVVLVAVVAVWWSCVHWLPRARALPRALGVLAVLGLASLTVLRNRVYASPVELYQGVIELAPGNARAYTNLGIAYINEGRLDEAIDILKTSARLDPVDPYAHYNLAGAYVRRGDTELAIQSFERAIVRQDSVASESGLANALFQTGEFSQAEAHYRRALELGSRDGRDHFGLASTLRKLGRLEEALPHLEAALQLDPKNAGLHADLAVTLSMLDRPAEALPHYQRALEIPPETAAEQANLAQCLAVLGRGDEALEHFRVSMRMDGSTAEARVGAARILLERPDADERREALRLAEEAERLPSSNRVAVLETLAAACAATGDFERAVATLDQALELPGPSTNPARAERLRAKQAEYRRKGER